MKPKISRLIKGAFVNESKYELLEDNLYDSVFKDTMSNLNNLIGLEDQGWFKITNISNNLVIELNGSTLICSPDNAEKSEIQTFKASVLPDGNFSISSRQQASPTALQVWDYLPHRKLLVQRKQSVGKRNNQSWISGHVPGFQSSYFLISAPDCDKCIKSMGGGQQIIIVDKSDAVVADPLAHWKLVPLGPVVPSVPAMPNLTQAPLIPEVPSLPVLPPLLNPLIPEVVLLQPSTVVPSVSVVTSLPVSHVISMVPVISNVTIVSEPTTLTTVTGAHQVPLPSSVVPMVPLPSSVVPQVLSTSSVVPQVPSPSSAVPQAPLPSSGVPQVPSRPMIPQVPPRSLGSRAPKASLPSSVVPQAPVPVPQVPSPPLVSQLPSSTSAVSQVPPMSLASIVPAVHSMFVAPVVPSVSSPPVVPTVPAPSVTSPTSGHDDPVVPMEE